MTRRVFWIAAAQLLGVACSRNIDPAGSGTGAPASSRERPAAVAAASPLDGLWLGSWGGGERDGTVFQPALAELWIQDARAELARFPGVSHLAGIIDVDASSGRVRITPSNDNVSGPQPQAHEFGYELDGDALTLTDSGGRAIAFERRRVVQGPAANAHAEFFTATGVTATGDLMVVEYGALALGATGATWYEPRQRSLNTNGATILLAGEAAMSEITIDEARELLREPMPAVILYRPDDFPPADGSYALRRDLGPPPPDGDAVRQTLARVIRPGTLVFVLSARANIPQP